jgi:hypothetical protein
MNREDVEIIAEVLRQKVVKIREMFRPPDAHVTDVERFAQVQVLTLAHDIGIAFTPQDPTFDNILVEAVQLEIYRDVSSEEQKPATTNSPWGRVENTPEREAMLGGAVLWCRVFDGEKIFTVLPVGTVPGLRDGRYYYTVDEALAARPGRVEP